MITKIRVKNYRSIGDVTLNLGKLNVLVGPNGSGKSNFIDALRFVTEILQFGIDLAIRNRDGYAKIARLVPKKSRDISFEFEINRNKRDSQWAKYSFDLEISRNNKVSVKREYCAVNWQGSFSEYLYEKGNMVKSTNLKLEPAVEDNSLVLTAIAGAKPFSFVRSTLINMSFCTIYPNAIRSPQQPSSLESLEEHGENLAAILKQMKNRGNQWLPDMKLALSKVVSDIRDFKVQDIGGYLIIKFLHVGLDEDKGNWFDASQESDGTLRILGLLTGLTVKEKQCSISLMPRA